MNRQQATLKRYNDTWNTVILKKRLVYSLKECLESYDEEMLRQLGHTLGVKSIKQGEGKPEWVDQLTSAIQRDMKQQLPYLTRRQAYFLLEGVEKPYINTLSEAFGMDTVFALVQAGWVYWFEVGEEIRFVLPKELKKIMKDTFYEGEFFFQQQKYYELSEYIEAFVHLYGVFDRRHLLAVWNDHHPDDWFVPEQLNAFIQKLNGRQSVFESQGQLIYASGELDGETAEHMMDDMADIPYYVPQPEEIRPLAYKNPAQETVQFHQLEKYVRRWILYQPENVLNAVLHFVRIGLPVETVIEELEMEGWVDPGNTAFMNTFSFLYKKLLNDSRSWLCRGHTAYERKRMQTRD